jgi:hypothetical protein
LIRDVVRTPTDLEAVAKKLEEEIWGLTKSAPTRFGVKAADFAVPTSLPELSMTLNTSECTANPRLVLELKNGGEFLSHDDESLMREFFPLRLHLAKKRYVMIPIYKEWVEAMLSSTGHHEPLKLRVNHAYYCYPKISALTKGDFVLFYETKTKGGRGMVIGAAIVQEVLIEKPSKVFRRFASMGIYELSDVEAHKNSSGNAMGIKFGLFEHFSSPVALARVHLRLQNKTTVQGLTPISREGFEHIRAEGLS